MNKEEALKQYKSLFPNNVEAIVLTKEDYDRQLGKLQYENIELQERIDKAIEYIKHYGNLYCLRHKQFKEYKQYEDLLDILKGNYDKE